MKRYLFLLLALLSVVTVSAQDDLAHSSTVVSEPIKLWTSNFHSLVVDANIKLVLVALPDDQAPYIIYDTKGVETSNFIADVDREGVLHISEKVVAKRVEKTEVELYYHNLDNITISRADVRFEGLFEGKIVDIDISNKATLSADVDLLDLKIRVSGDSRVELSGKVLYHDAEVSAAKYDAQELSSMAAIVLADRNAEVWVDAVQRLEAKSGNAGKIYYKQQPEIYRMERRFLGVDAVELK